MKHEAAAQFYPTWILKDFRRLHAVLIYNYETYMSCVVTLAYVKNTLKRFNNVRCESRIHNKFSDILHLL
jgi:hypothetical protein